MWMNHSEIHNNVLKGSIEPSSRANSSNENDRSLNLPFETDGITDSGNEGIGPGAQDWWNDKVL